MSGHLTIEKIAELRRSLKRQAIMCQKSGGDTPSLPTHTGRNAPHGASTGNTGTDETIR